MKMFRGLIPPLPRVVWFYELGVVVNNLGSGMIAPFTVLYLYNVRGFSLGMAGAVTATFAGMSFLAAFAGGSLADRIGPRRALLGALILQSAGLFGFAFADTPLEAFGFMALVGLGNGAFIPCQSSLLAAVVPENARQAAFSVQRMAENLGMGLGGATAGLIAVSSKPSTYTLIFLIDAVTVLLFALMVIILVRRPLERPKPPQGDERAGYRAVFQQKLILSIVTLNIIYVFGGYAVFEMVFPAVAKNGGGLSERAIGLIYLLNTFTVAFTQLPLLKWFAGKRRMHILAGMCALWGVTWVAMALVVAAAPSPAWAFVAFALAAMLFAVGEGGFSVQNALIVDLAPEYIRGRCMALVPSTFTFGFMLGTLSFGFMLESSFVVVWLVAAGLLALAGARAFFLDGKLPPDKQRVPRPDVEEDLEEAAAEASTLMPLDPEVPGSSERLVG